MSGGDDDQQIGVTKFQLFVKGVRGGTDTIVVHKVSVFFCGRSQEAALKLM